MRTCNVKGRRNRAARLAGRFTQQILVMLALASVALVGGQWRSRAATDRFVAVGGSDTGNDCTLQGNPCATIQHAINQSA